MKEFALRAGVGASNIVNTAVDRARGLGRNERGDIVQTVVITAILVVAAVVVLGLIFTALKTQGTAISNCISGVNTNGTCDNFGK